MPRNHTISANTLFHFTKSMDILESILVHNFYPRYCLEIMTFFSHGQEKELAIPMISFCDIPLSQVSDHADDYGHYAIGLNKEWGLTNHVTPVIYTHSESPLPLSMHALFEQLAILKPEEKSWTDPFLTLSMYLKSYQEPLWRNGVRSNNLVRFYDEREWRYIPPNRKMQQAGCPSGVVITKEEFLNCDDANSKLQSCSLGFTPNDIKYLILDKEDEIPSFIKRLKQIKSHKYSPDTIDLLLTRITSMQHIRDDF